MNILKKRLNYPKSLWICRGLFISILGAVVLSCFYGVINNNAKKHKVNVAEQHDNIEWLYKNSILLYGDLYNVQNETQLEHTDIYLAPKENYEWLLDEAELEKRCDSSKYEEMINSNGEESTLSPDGIYWDEACDIQQDLDSMENYFRQLEGQFSVLNNFYDYVMLDNRTGKYVTNMATEEAEKIMNPEVNYNRYFLLTLQFDSVGNVSVGRAISENEDTLRKNANEIVRKQLLPEDIPGGMSAFKKYGEVKRPVDCTLVYAASADKIAEISGVFEGNYYYATVNSIDALSVEMYRCAGLDKIILFCVFLFFILGLFLPVLKDTKPWNDSKLCALPFEPLFCFGVFLFALCFLAERLVVYVASGYALSSWESYIMGIPRIIVGLLVGVYNLFVLTIFFFCFWYLGVCGRALREKGLIGYIRERSLIYRFFPFLKRKILAVYSVMEHLDLTKDANKTIIKVLIVNAIILFIISIFWVGGIFMIAVYSLILYLILRKYVSDLQRRYGILWQATNKIADGNLNVNIDEDLGVFEPFKPQIIRIQDGFQKAVEEEVKSQKMKTELITNVSHDLKTPLTAIITYINLLKNEAVTEEQRKEYLDVLERKSLRLKVLIEDLFEVSKANTGNITLNLTAVDIMNLIKQVSFEMSDKFSASGLEVRTNLADEKILLSLDSEKTYRIYENLLGNIAKYAMKGTRVYINGFKQDDKVIITLKNISAQELTVNSADLTERFVRGDASRNTEGSGLGLAIAKSFVELQGGELILETDGDLFKATTVWKMAE